MAAGREVYLKRGPVVSIFSLCAAIVVLLWCQGHTSLASYTAKDVFAVAFPADLSPSAVETVLEKHGIDTVIHERNLLIPMTDFVNLKYIPVSELARRVQEGDPRHTPLSNLILSAFYTSESERGWRVWFIPVTTISIYSAVRAAFLELGSDWAWDAQLPSPVLRFHWVVWLAWIIWLLLGKHVSDRLYHSALILGWLPLAFVQNLPAAALMVVGQGFSAVLGMTVIANGRLQKMSSPVLRRMAGNLSPFLLSMLVLLAMDSALLVPVLVALGYSLLLVRFRYPVMRLLSRRHFHPYPSFRLILDESIKAKAGRLGLWSLLPLTLLALMLLFAPDIPEETPVFRLSFGADESLRSHALDYSGMIRAHIVYQEALAWGRLGDAEWRTESYSRPYRFMIQDNRVVRTGTEHGIGSEGFQASTELDKELRRILEHTRGGEPLLTIGGDSLNPKMIWLDSVGGVFYSIALIPLFVVGFKILKASKRKTVTQISNRQVA